MKKLASLPLLASLLSASAFAGPPRYASFVEFFRHERPRVLEARAIFLGEEHRDFALKERLVDVVNAIRAVDPAYDCLALEMAVEYQGEIDAIVAGDTTPAQAETRVFEEHVPLLARRPRYSSDEEPIEIEYARGVAAKFRPWFDLVRALRGNMRIFAADLSRDAKVDPAEPALMVRRNKVMAQAIRSRISDGACRKVVGLNGASHLYDAASDGRSLPSMLPEASPLAIELSSRASFETAGPEDRVHQLAVEPGRITVSRSPAR